MRRKPNFCWAVVDRDLRQIEAGWCVAVALGSLAT